MQPELLPGQSYILEHCPPGSDALFLAGIFRSSGHSMVWVLSDDFALDQAREALRLFSPDINPVVFPAWDCLPYDRVSPSIDVMAQRMRVLCDLRREPDKKILLLTTAAALLQRLPDPAFLDGRQIRFKQNGACDPDQLTRFLNENGYQRTGTVREVGEYAIRGSLIDIFPQESERPLRIDLFGNVIETMHYFDPISQRREDVANEIALYPVHEILLDEKAVSLFRSNYRELFGAEAMNDPIYETVSAGSRHPGMEHWLPFFYEKTALLTDYITNTAVVQGQGLNSALQDRWQEINDYYEARAQFLKGKAGKGPVAYRPLPKDALFLSESNWAELLSRHAKLRIEMGSAQKTGDEIVINVAAKPVSKMVEIKALSKIGLSQKIFAAFREFAEASQKDGKRLILACYSPGSRDRLDKMLREYEMKPEIADNWADALRLPADNIALLILPLENGFSYDDFILISEQDLLGDRLSRGGKRERKAENVLFEASSLSAGDYVVHIDHGIGRFIKLETLQVAGADHDCLCLEYLGGDKLYVPVENIELLSRYSDGDTPVQPDKLGGAAWQARKARVKQRLREMAEQLIRIAAARQVKQADILPIPQGYDQFCARFPYVETQDQMRAIEDTSRDLALGRPMDRLVCGDVGFGKTEVALRAAYIAASQGAQVAVVVPTTLLARQHYLNFVKRFDGIPLRIAQLSRMVGAGESAQVKQDLADHKVDIVIGTHALLAKTIKFAHLGLLIVDEEQHFGVGQKERLKEFQANVHVLTLSATPIPRTLQMALTGVRDLSIIATPPVDRHAVQTHVMPYDPMIVREAILRERHRGGQSFYVCPRIEDLDEVAEKIRALLPDIRLCIAHGQLSAGALEQVMQDFYEGKYELLLSTNIIESGLDIPSANTIIIHRADMFGLSQLYQLRGRVGRTKIRAYAYLTIPERRVPTESAQKRLDVMQTLDHLGAGFTVASHDMDIRGAGNLLGEEQSGHVREVGIELYQHLLQEAVMAVRDQKPGQAITDLAPAFSPQINLGIPVLIPESYIEDLATRLSFYRRISTLKDDAEIQACAAEMVDRFGAMPQEVENLLVTVSIKNLCLKAGIEKVDAGPKGAVISFHQNKFSKPEALIKFIQDQRGTVKIRPDQKLVLMRGWEDAKAKIQGVRSFMTDIEKLAA